MSIFDFFKKKKIDENYTAFELVNVKQGDYISFYKKLIGSSLILLIIGKRGSGKTALGMKVLELFNKKTNKKCYILGYDKIKLPRWIIKVDNLEKIPNNSTVLVDEGAVSFFSREAMKNPNKNLSKIMAIARHKNLTLTLITQNSAMIDLNVLRLADSLLLKEPSLLQSNFERKALKDIYDNVSLLFKDIKDKHSHFVVWDDDFQGILKYNLPDFWSEDVSKSFKNY